jgi:hypothetical protein
MEPGADDGLFVVEVEPAVDGVVLPLVEDCLCVSLAYAEPAASASSENARVMERTVISNLLYK